MMIIDLLTYAKIKPVINQIEVHPYNSQSDLIKFCQSQKINITAYSPLGGQPEPGKIHLFEESVIKTIAQKYKKTPSQIILNWGITRNTIVIPKSTHPDRILENIQIFDFNLTKSEMDQINKLNQDVGFKKHLIDLETSLHKGNIEVQNKVKDKIIEERNKNLAHLDIRELLDLINSATPEIKEVTMPMVNSELRQFKSINRSYNTKLKEKIKWSILDSFKDDVEIPLILTNIYSENTSTLADKKETLNITFKTLDKVNHSVKIDFPTIINDEFLIINGNKKIILKQI
jgi:hypothetical protein